MWARRLGLSARLRYRHVLAQELVVPDCCLRHLQLSTDVIFHDIYDGTTALTTTRDLTAPTTTTAVTTGPPIAQQLSSSDTGPAYCTAAQRRS